ncbi:PPE domain-containing protein, partial [Amycolatopsis alkalitolerans]
MSEKNLPYNTHRKHRYYTQDHPLSAGQRRRIRRLRQIQKVNQRESTFGKINWQAYDHQQLWDMVQSSDPSAMGTAAHRWAKLAVDVDSATADVHKTVQKLLLSWRGGSAVSAADSASKLTAWGAGASGTMREIGDGLDTYTSALIEARNRMPEPVYYSDVRHFREGYDVQASSGPSGAILADQLLDDHLPSKREATRAKAEAVRVMDQYEATSKGVHEKLPTFGEAPAVTTGQGGGDPAPGSPTGDPGTDGTVAASAAGGAPPGLGGAGSVPGGGSLSGGGLTPGDGRALTGGGMSASEAGAAGAGRAAAAAAGAAATRGAGGAGGVFPGALGGA